MTDKRSTGLRCALAVLLAAPLALVAVVAGPAGPATALSCARLTAVVSESTADRTEALVTLPAGLMGRPVPASALTVRQGRQDVPVLDFGPGLAADTDVVVVLDTAARSAPVAAAVRAAVTGLLGTLPPATSVGLVTTGGSADVAHPLGTPARAGIPAAEATRPAGPGALIDAVLLAVRELPGDPERQQHLVVVAAGPDESSTADWETARSLIARRGVALDVLDLASVPSLPTAGGQCPGQLPAADATAAGRALATQITDRRRLVLPFLEDRPTVLVTLSYAGTSASTTLVRREGATVPDLPVRGSDDAGQLGVGTLVLAFLVGLLGLAVLLVGVTARSPRAPVARAAARDLLRAVLEGLDERDVPDEERRVPRAESRRRVQDAWQDLNSALGGAPSARELAERAARDEQTARAAASEHEEVLRERAAAKDRAAERHLRALRRAELLAAEDRALRDTLALHGAPLPDASGALSAAERAQLAAVAEANRVLATLRAAAEEATGRRQAAEQAADESARLAQREKEAAAAAQRERQAAEQAAADAEQRALRERQFAGEASEARQAAEQQASVAVQQAADERQAAEEALARRQEAEARAAAAESAETLAAARELAAREAAEAAEVARQDAVARLEEQRLALEQELAARRVEHEESARQELTREVLAQQAAHEQAVREAAARELAARDAALEQAALETQAREAALEAAALQTAAREAALEQAARETAAREAALEESARESAARQAALVESARETAAREAALEQAARETALREAALEQAAREQAAREAALEQAARETALREAALEQATQEQAAREAALEQAAREQTAREAALEQAARELAARDLAARDLAARDLAARDLAARDLAARELAAREATPDVDLRPAAAGPPRPVPTGNAVAAAADPRARRLHVVARALAEAEEEPDVDAEKSQRLSGVGTAAPGSADHELLMRVWEWADDPEVPFDAAKQQRRRRSLHAVPVVRALATLLVPIVAALRTLLQGSWWTGAGTVNIVLVVAAVLLTGLGTRWIWAATSEPFTLLRRTARRIDEERGRLAEQATAAADLLATVREGRTDAETWEEFEERTGLVVPGSTRSALDPGMDPHALVRYLAARQQALQEPQSLLMVTIVPLLTCLAPAALLLLSA